MLSGERISDKNRPATDVGCVSERPAGLLLKSEQETATAIHRLLNDSELARTLDTLLNEPERRRRLSAEGRVAVQSRYSWEGILERYEALFTQLLRPDRNPPSGPSPLDETTPQMGT